TVRLWDVHTGKEVLRFRSDWGVRGVALAPNDYFALSFITIWQNNKQSARVTLWDVAARKRKQTFALDMARIACVAFSSDGRRILVGGNDGSIWSADLLTGKQLVSYPGDIATGRCVAFSPDGRIALVGTAGDACIRVLDARNGKETGKWAGHTRDVATLAFSA